MKEKNCIRHNSTSQKNSLSALWSKYLCTPKIPMLTPNLQCYSIKRWDLWDMIRWWGLWPHKCSIITEAWGSLLSHHMRTHIRCHKWGMSPHQIPNLLAGTLILDFPASRTVSTIFLSCINYSTKVFCYSSPKCTKKE